MSRNRNIKTSNNKIISWYKLFLKFKLEIIQQTKIFRLSYGRVHVVEYIRVGRDNSILQDQIIIRVILAHIFVIRGFRGRTIAMYLIM